MYGQKVDNFSFFKPGKLRDKGLKAYLKNSFETMKGEALGPKVDSVYENGRWLKTFTTTNHQPVTEARNYK